MRPEAWWRRRHVVHAIRVAAVSTLVIGILYVVIVVAVNTVDRHRLVGEVANRLDRRLTAIAHHPSQARSIAEFENTHDIDDAPVFVWKESPTGGSLVALTPGSPALRAASVPKGTSPTQVRLGAASFVLRAERIGSTTFIAGQTLADADRVSSDLAALELIAGPILLLGVFLGTLLIGAKAAAPVELARRRQIEFTADASHELRTPLSVIEAEVSLSLSSERTGPQYRATLQRVQQESRRLEEIVEDLLWLSRFDSAPPPRTDLSADISSIAIACADRFDAVARQREIALTVGKEGEVAPLVGAPPEWVDRLATVLVDNACRYAGRGGKVRIVTRAQGHCAWLRIEDSGPGIDPADRPYLFDRFHRATDEGNGAGLGLAIGDSVVRATGGQWRIARSELGGALMEVRWPRMSTGRTSGQASEVPGSPRPDPANASEAPGHDDSAPPARPSSRRHGQPVP